MLLGASDPPPGSARQAQQGRGQRGAAPGAGPWDPGAAPVQRQWLLGGRAALTPPP